MSRVRDHRRNCASGLLACVGHSITWRKCGDRGNAKHYSYMANRKCLVPPKPPALSLTYPQVYLSFSEVYASDSCGPVGSTVYHTIIPVPTNMALSSIWMTLNPNGDGGPFGENAITGTSRFNFTDLNTPVPYSIYSSQAWCQSEIAYWLPAITHKCPMTLPYMPIISLPPILSSLDPAWMSCRQDIRGVFDPPIALAPASVMATATDPSIRLYHTASPSSSPTAPLPRHTSASFDPRSSVSPYFRSSTRKHDIFGSGNLGQSEDPRHSETTPSFVISDDGVLASSLAMPQSVNIDTLTVLASDLSLALSSKLPGIEQTRSYSIRGSGELIIHSTSDMVSSSMIANAWASRQGQTPSEMLSANDGDSSFRTSGVYHSIVNTAPSSSSVGPYNPVVTSSLSMAHAGTHTIQAFSSAATTQLTSEANVPIIASARTPSESASISSSAGFSLMPGGSLIMIFAVMLLVYITTNDVF